MSIVALYTIKEANMVTWIKYFTADGLTVKQHDFHSDLIWGCDVTETTGSMLIPFIYIIGKINKLLVTS